MKEIHEPELTHLLRECEDREIYPLSIIKFVGGVAVWLEEEEPQIKLWEGEP